MFVFSIIPDSSDPQHADFKDFFIFLIIILGTGVQQFELSEMWLEGTKVQSQ